MDCFNNSITHSVSLSNNLIGPQRKYDLCTPNWPTLLFTMSFQAGVIPLLNHFVIASGDI